MKQRVMNFLPLEHLVLEHRDMIHCVHNQRINFLSFPLIFCHGFLLDPSIIIKDNS